MRIKAEIAATSTTAPSVVDALRTTLFSAAAASTELGITVEDTPTGEIASPPPPPLTPPSPLSPLRPPPMPPAPEDNSGNLKEDSDPNDSLTITLSAVGSAAAVVLVAFCCLFYACSFKGGAA